VIEYVAGRNPMAGAAQKDIFIAHESGEETTDEAPIPSEVKLAPRKSSARGVKRSPKR